MHALFNDLSTNLRSYWEKHPALHSGFCILLGIGIAYFPYLLLASVFLLHKRALIIPFATLYALWTMPPLLHEPVSGTAHFKIDSVKRHFSHYSSRYCYTGKIRSIGPYKNIVARIYSTKKLYPANCEYFIHNATLMPNYTLISKERWEKIPGTFSLAQTRFTLKNLVKKQLGKSYRKAPLELFSALLTGDVDSLTLRYNFSQLGLSHLVAISGFHFAFLAALLALVCRKPLFLILILSLYALYIGPAPSLSRSHIAITIFLIARLFYLQTTPLNALGAGLSIALILEPTLVSHVGFQLSYAATLGILLLFRPFEQKLRFLLPPRPYYVLSKMSLLDKHGYLLSSLIRNTLALTIAVNITTIPLLLYHFHTFPLLSLIYNLFFPFLILISLLLIPFPTTNTLFTNAVLSLTTYPPKKYAYTLSVGTFPKWLILTICIITICYGVLQAEKSHPQEKSRHPPFF